MKRVQILISTYNGEKYLSQQLDSITKLSNFDEIKVLIRDDGSSDSTRDILNSYHEQFGFEIIYGENLGLNASMHKLISERDRSCEYFSFGDQDDYWLENKVALGVEMLDKEDNSSPVLYAARSFITDEKLNIKGEIMNPKRRLSFYNAMIQNVAAGHTQIANNKLCDLIEMRFSKDIIVFDYWVYTVATAFGKVVFDSTCTTLYRQHGKNVIGYETNIFQTIKNRIKRVLTTDLASKMTVQLRAFTREYGDMIPDEYRKEATKFLSSQTNFFKRLGYVFVTKAYRNSRLEGIIFRFMYLFGQYNVKKQKYKNK